MSADPRSGPDLGPLGLDVEPRKARPVQLTRGLAPGAAFARIAAECTDHWRENEGALRSSRAAPHLHQTRVGIRRLRSSFSLFRPLVRQVPGAFLVVHRLRSLVLPFGTARDLDVLLTGPLVADLSPARVALLLEERETSYDTVLAVLHSPEWAAVGADLDALVARVSAAPSPGGDGPDALTALARAALEKRSRRVVGCLGRLSSMTPTDRHRVRIEAKKLRYGCEFFAALFPADRPRLVTEEGEVLVGALAHARLVEDVQSSLGALNDHATADRLLHRVGSAAPPVDEEARLRAGVAAVERLAAVEPFWR